MLGDEDEDEDDDDDDDDKIALHRINDPPSNLNASPLQVD